MPRFLRSLQVNEVSGVDRGAGKGVRIVLMKRDESDPGGSPAGGRVGKKNKAYLSRNIFTEAEARAKAEKREFSADERRRLAGSRAAMADGSFPIENEADLKNAIRAVGRAKNPARARAHIISRARSLDLTRLLPDDWAPARKALDEFLRYLDASGIAKALDFNAAQANAEAGEYASGVMAEIREAICSLEAALCEIMCDAAVTDKQAAFETSLKQFQDHLAGLVPEGVEQALQAAQLIAQGVRVNAQGAIVKRKGPTMADQNQMPPGAANEKGKGRKKMKALKQKAKALKRDLRKRAAEAVALKKKLETIEKSAGADTAATRVEAVIKLAPEHRDWFFHAGNQMSPADRLAFLDADVEKRNELVAAAPIEKLEERRLAALPAELRKAQQDASEAKDIAKRAEDDRLTTEMTKRAGDLSLPAELVPHMVSIHKASPDALKAVERVLKAFDAQTRTAVIFKEFGSSHGNDDAATATAKIQKRVDELMASATPPKSRNSAVAKIAASADEADQALWLAYKEELDGRKAA